MAKPGFFEDTFEKIIELGKSTAQTPVSGTDKRGVEQLEKGQGKKQKHTPLDFQKLQKTYEEQDKQKSNVLRQRLFQMVKSGEEKAIAENRQKEMDRKRKDEYERAEKKKKEEERKKREAAQQIPKGKIRRSIFTPLKVAKREQAEVKPSAGKQ